MNGSGALALCQAGDPTHPGRSAGGVLVLAERRGFKFCTLIFAITSLEEESAHLQWQHTQVVIDCVHPVLLGCKGIHSSSPHTCDKVVLFSRVCFVVQQPSGMVNLATVEKDRCEKVGEHHPTHHDMTQKTFHRHCSFETLHAKEDTGTRPVEVR